MAGARQHTALPPREPARAAPLPRPAPSLTAASRPRPPGRGAAPPAPSEVGPGPAGSGSNWETSAAPLPRPAARPLAVGLYRCLRPRRAPVCGSSGGRARRRGGLETTEVTCLRPSLPAAAARGPA